MPNPGEGPRRKHLVTNIIVDYCGETAVVQSNFVLVREAGKELAISIVGSYADQVQKQDGMWLFRQRTLTLDLLADLGLKNPFPI